MVEFIYIYGGIYLHLWWNLETLKTSRIVILISKILCMFEYIQQATLIV